MGGELDAMKLRSSMTLFDAASPNNIFAQVLDVFFNGERDPMTLKLLAMNLYSINVFEHQNDSKEDNV